MNIISIDLPWKADKRERTALAVTDLDGNTKVMRVRDENEMIETVRDYTEQKSLVLLDIPIDGCEELKKNNANFRPVDTALLKQRISIQPSSGIQNRGKGLEERIKGITQGKSVIVREIYPYAIYKFLAYLKDRNLLQHLALDKFDTLLDDKFRTHQPPKYKREKKNKGKRIRYMKYLYSLLSDSSQGLKFLNPLGYPNISYTWSKLDRLCDDYDACLGAIVGIHFANNSSYACVAGDSGSGNILLLADRWLAGRLGKEVRVSNLKE